MSIINDFLLNLPLPLLDHWGYLIIFISAIIEALPVLGTFFPGHTIVVLGGFFANLEILRLDGVILTAAAGAMVGDLIGYIIGRKYGQDFVARYGKYFFLHQDKFEATKKLVHEHAGKTLILGRFSPLTRAFAPMVAGISRVKILKFIIYDIIGGLAWAVSSVLLGYIFGQGFETASKYFGRIIIAGILVIALIIFGYRWLNKRKHIFSRYHLHYLVINAFSIYVFSKMIEDYLQKESTYRLDLWLEQNIYLVWGQNLSQLMIFITNLFSPEVLFSIALAAAAYYLYKKNLYKALLIFFGSSGGLLLGAALKILINRPRPEDGLISETGFSLPSQHALLAAIFFALVYLLFAKKIKNRWLKYLFAAGNTILICAVGFSRLYLRVHYFSDVLAGYALGLFWLTFLILVFRITSQIVGDPLKFFRKGYWQK